MPLDTPSDEAPPPAALMDALAHHEAGRSAEAEAGYRAILATDPGQGQALYLYGMLALQTARAAEAVPLLARATQAHPDHAEGRFALGNALWQTRDKPAAIAAWQQALLLEPRHLGAVLNLAKARADTGDYGATVALCHEATRIAPRDPCAHAALGAALLGGGQPEAALRAADTALALEPNTAEAHFLRGTALKQLGRTADAAGALAQAAALAPRHAKALLNLGNAELLLGDAAAAEQHCRAALAADPNMAEAHASLGCLLTNGGRLPEAISACRDAIALKPELADAHWNLGIAQLLGGDLQGGFAEYEWRKRHPAHRQDFRRLPQPEWQGEDLTGRTLLVLAEQGLGDAIMFARFLEPLAQRGARVLLACDRRLIPLLAAAPGVARAVPRDRELPDCDFWVDQMSLPHRLGTTLATIPAAAGYLRADPARVAAWAARLPKRREGARRIGLAWAGNPLHSNDARRSCPAAALRPLTAMAGDEFVSLQVGPEAAEARSLGLADHSAGLLDLADTAGLLAGLDLLITVDTAVAHAAAALGKPTWLMLPHAPDWRWLLGRSDSPWYASARLFRQPKPGDWNAVVASIAQSLATEPPALY
jgi:tetratricopeptide (TPR) repeat protein